MLFTELRFFVFFLVVFACYWAIPASPGGSRARKLLLLAGSYLFYAAWNWKFLFLIIASTLVDYVVGGRLDRARSRGARKGLLWVSLVLNLGLLSLFKYFNWFVDSAVDLLLLLGFEAHPFALQLILPVGISFYTFQTLSYTIDIYRGSLRHTDSLLDFALFVGFFPQLVAGPIVRASSFLPQLDAPRRWGDVAFRSCLSLFLIGFFKKACVADNLSMAADLAFKSPDAFGLLDLWLADLLWCIQAYCDFSGYSDMAIATAGLLGYRLVLNFNFPYLARSFTDLWRRWHISLTSWLRDYVYIPLGGNRVNAGRVYFNLVTVFVLCGLWHGARWTYIVFGLYNGLFLILERRMAARGWDLVRGPLWRLLYAQLVWWVGMVIFRAPDMDVTLRYLAGMFGLGGGASAHAVPAQALDAEWWWVVAAFWVAHAVMGSELLHPFFRRLPDWAWAVTTGVLAAAMLPLVASDYQAFIYFQF